MGGIGLARVFLVGVTIAIAAARPPAVRAVGPAESAQPPPTPAAREWSLAQCLDEAMQNSRRRRVSRFAVAMAEAQHRQALAGYWPQLGAKGTYQHLGRTPDFLFPATSVSVPAGTATITLPPGVLGPTPVQLPVATPAQSFAVPAQDVKLSNPDNFLVSVQASWLLYDGGMRGGLGEQTDSLVAIMKEDARRTDLEIVESVSRLYYGALLARQLVQVGDTTLRKMATTLDLTEALYKRGSSRVAKTDWLDNKVMVETIRAMVAELERNQAMAEGALAGTIGLPWNASVRPVDGEIPFEPFAGDLEQLVSSAYRFNPDWRKMQAAIRAAQGAVTTARSEHFPKLAAVGEAHRWWNTYDAGLATDNNKAAWSVGVGVELPLFSGFATARKVDEAEARASKVREEQLLLKDGLGLQLKDAFLRIGAASKTFRATLDARSAAAENSELTARAYESGLIETDKIIRAQLEEALMSAQHLKAAYDHVAARSQLRMLVGTDER